MDRIDFLPERIRVKRQRNRRLVLQANLLVACVVALAALAYVRQGKLTQAQAELNLLCERSAEAGRQLELKASLERQQAELMIMQRIEGHLGSRVNTLDVLAEIERLMPESMVLADLSIEAMEVSDKSRKNGAAAVTPISATPGQERTVKRLRLVLTGLAPNDVDVANFIGQMSASPLFEDVNMGYAKNVVYHGRGAREFQTSCYVVR